MFADVVLDLVGNSSSRAHFSVAGSPGTSWSSAAGGSSTGSESVTSAAAGTQATTFGCTVLSEFLAALATFLAALSAFSPSRTSRLSTSVASTSLI